MRVSDERIDALIAKSPPFLSEEVLSCLRELRRAREAMERMKPSDEIKNNQWHSYNEGYWSVWDEVDAAMRREE